ncbi:PQQ-dependent sugar dehydrogenase [Anaerolinea thermophila]|uniref:PQQ-dependent sugar dehydrogenase n=1 Tax=Anaerolinea thermophila TaxID=167964 RepID=UPI0002F12810|nr:PQQ-dependent sugar dehydrogenase [Anaerolinea thermophila]
MRFVRRLFPLILLLGVLLAACSPQATPSPQPPTTTAPAPSAPETPTLYAPPAASNAGGTVPTLEGYQPPAETTPVPTSEAAYPAPGGNTVSSVTAFPDPAQFTWVQAAAGFQRPLDLADLSADGSRLLVLEQRGVIALVENGARRETPFLDIVERVGSSGNEQGLLGIALHPRFNENGFFYVNYTDRKGDTVIARFTANAERTAADPASEYVLLRVDQPAANHNGGGLTFGRDGYLYIGLGDGGQGGDPWGNAQSLKTHLGKLLRISVDGGEPYAIPANNPFADGQKGLAEIWAYGLRNPWRFSFDRLTGDLYIGDVGQNLYEEIDFLPAGSPGGANFGWDYREGLHPYEGTPPADAVFVEPVAEYAHPVGCSVTGGFVYRGAALPEFQGVYLYADYCTGKVWGLLRQADGTWKSQELFQLGGVSVSSFGQDALGEVYITDHQNGALLKLVRQSQ